MFELFGLDLKFIFSLSDAFYRLKTGRELSGLSNFGNEIDIIR